MTSPYADAAWAYRRAGWLGVIPIGRGPAQKSPPPTSFTGWTGVDPSGPDIQTWIDGREGAYNVGLHLPVGVVAIDVDAYHGGDVTLATLEAQHGPLPPTWSNTARGRRDPSRHRFYRAILPEGRMWIDHPGGHGGGIDVLHVGHRYAVVWPSVNPQAAGATYEWYDPDGEPCGIPSPGDLPELPPEWLDALTRDGAPLPGSAATDRETHGALSSFRTGPPCLVVTRLLNAELLRIGKAEHGEGGLHMPGPLYALVSFGLEGHRGVGAALSQHQAVYTAARVSARRESQAAADAEWWRQVRGAVGKSAPAAEPCICPESEADCLDFPGSLAGAASSATSTAGSTPAYPDLEALLGSGVSLSLTGSAPDDGPPDFDEVAAELAAEANESKRLDRAYEVARAVAELDDDEHLPWRDLLKDRCGLTFTDFRTIVKAERERRAVALAERRRTEARVQAARQGGDELPHRAAPMPVARALYDRYAARGEFVRQWRGDWYLWRGTHWHAVSTAHVRHMVYAETGPAWYQDPQDGPTPWNPDTASVSKVIDALGHTVAYRPDADEDDRCIAVANGVLDLATRTLQQHSPARFNLWSLPYAYDPTATAPAWEAFLQQVMPDPENRQLLREWFGYMVSGRTDLQKILSLFGAPRSGKGTVLRVLVGLVGAENRATVTLGQLASTFGRQSLIGRAMAQITDANWNIRDVDTAVEALKSISGEDDQGIDRKNQITWEGKLGARFVLVANAMPKFNDPSGALLARMLHIEFTRSFVGAEDETLTPRLLGELPGILNWALAGLDELTARGRLLVPAASREAAEEIERNTSPVAAWLRDRTEMVSPDSCVALYLDELHRAYTAYCLQAGATQVAKRDTFARDLRAAGAGKLRIERRRVNGVRQQLVYGLALTDPLAAAFDEPTLPARR